MSDEETLEIIEEATGTITLRGDLDAHTAPQVAARLESVAGGELRLGCAELEFVDSSGVQVLVSAHTRLRSGGGRLVLESPSSALRRVLEITGLADEFELS